MKKYEKPMAIYDNFDLNDIITASVLDVDSNPELKNALHDAGAILNINDNVALYEW